ncbi:hypothetical protein [Rhizobium leguminosarum]|uniref:hypothetical protein n=1 Tax=Rhizobium leguminosarum TaxID=384 RepID=UPI001FE18436|nr:hypothetical protein [Rhizobium leguminosarum]
MAERPRQRIRHIFNIRSRHAPECDRRRSAVLDFIQAHGEIVEVGDRESDLTGYCTVQPAPIPPCLGTAETGQFPRLEQSFAEYNREGELSNLVNGCSEPNACAWPTRGDLRHHGGVSVQDLFDARVSTNTHDKIGAEQFHCGTKGSLMDVDAFFSVFQIEPAKIV